MSKPLIFVISGRKQSGKTSLSQFILSEFINRKIGAPRFSVIQNEESSSIIDTFNNNKPIKLHFPTEDSDNILKTYKCKIYSFADPLKKICIEIFGLDFLQCYGSDEDKNSLTHILWKDVPKTSVKQIKKSLKLKNLHGKLSGRELMQVIGTEIFRTMDQNCWARGTYNLIAKENPELAIIADARFPNEITIGTEIGAKSIRLKRVLFPKDSHISETAMDDFPCGEYDCVIDNSLMSMQECHQKAKEYVVQIFKKHGV